MTFKLAYIEEDNKYRNLREEKVSSKQAQIIVKKVSRHFKLESKAVEFRGAVDCGHAYKLWGTIKVSWNPSLLVIAHELNHFLVWKKYPKKKVNHGSKKWHRCLKRIIDYCERKNWWKEEFQKAIVESQETRNRQTKQETYKKTPEYKLGQIQKAIKKWESKRRRAENAIKRLSRRQKIWEKKVNLESLKSSNKRPISSNRISHF
jgi:hypothetical protein